MEKWVTILTFKHPTQAHLIKTKLESEGIRVFLKNEVIAQLIPYGSEPASPIKMRIHEHDLDKAVKILKESGCLSGEQVKAPQSALINFIGGITANLPGFSNKPLRLRVILAVAVLLVVLVLVYSLLALPASV
ncbi:MAG: DUF2007 domain-containing protein [Bacteroidales bacterium]